jgi:Flp pilus assembly protein TadG
MRMQLMALSRLFRALSRCRAIDTSGIAALEFALSMPVLIVIFGGVTDLSIAIWDHITTAAAVNAGADYALTKGQTVANSSDVPPFLINVAAIVAGASRPGATLSTSNVVVTYNNATNGSNFSNTYCVPASGVFPGSPTASGNTCADGTTPGKFVRIQSTYVSTPLSPLDAAFLSGNYTDTVTVRVQ